jgi:autotransporter translocation and assembly factor TamB
VSNERKNFVPLLRSGLFVRVVKAVAVTVGLLFMISVVFLLWAFKTGRAVEAVRQEILVSLHDACGVNATFTSLSIDPIARELDLSNLEMVHLDGRPILSVEEAIVQLELLPLFYGRLQLERVHLLAPNARLEMVAGKMLNLPKCVEPPEETASRQPIALGVSELTIERGKIDVSIDDWFEGFFSDIGIALRPGRSGGTELVVGVDDGELEIFGRELPLHRLRVLGHIAGALTDPRALIFDDLAIDLAKLKTTGDGSIDLLGLYLEANITLDAPLEAIHDFVKDAPPVTGTVHLTLQPRSTIIDPKATARLVLKGVSVNEIGIGDEIDVELSINRKGAKLDKITALLGEGKVSGKGEVKFDESFHVAVDAKANDVSFGLLLHTLGIKDPWIDFGIENARVDLKGPLFPEVDLQGDFVTDVTNLTVLDRPYHAEHTKDDRIFAPSNMHATGRWGFSPDNIRFWEGHVTTGNTEAYADATIDFAPDGGFRINANLPKLDWIDIGPIAGLTFGGIGSLSGVLGGSYDDFGATGSFELDGIQVAGIPFGNGAGNITWRDLTRLEFANLEGTLGKTSYRGSVGVVVEGDVPLSITGEIPSGRIEDVLIPFGVDAKEWGDAKGDLFARVDLQGPVDKMTGPVEITLSKISILGEKAERGSVLGRLERGRVVADQIEIDKYGARISASGSIDPYKGGVRLDARTRSARLLDIDLVKTSQPHLDGALDLRLTLGGSLHGLTGTISADLSGTTAGPLQLGGGRIDGSIAGATLSLRGSIFERAIDLDGKLTLAKDLPYDVSLALSNLPAPEIVAGLANHRRWTGVLNGTAKLDGSLVDWHLSNGRITVRQAELETPSLSIATAKQARFTMKQGVLSTKSLSITGPRTQLQASGRFGSEILDLRVTGRIDLAIAELASSSVEKAGGTLSLDSAIRGSPKDLNLVGTGRVDGGFLQWRGFSSRLTGVTADLTFSQSSVLIDRAQGRWAGGRLGMTGSVLLERFYPENMSLELELAGVRPRFTYPKVDLSGTLDGKITAEGTFDHLVVRGNVGVRGGRIRPKISLSNLVRSGGISVDVYDPAAETVSFDLTLSAAEPIKMKNDEVDVDLTGAIRLTGTNERFGMLGVTTAVKGGHVALFGPEYEVESGTLELTDRYSFAPKYDVVVLAEACEALIRANVVGTLERFAITYTSNPEMDHQDVVSCFIRGVRVRNLEQDFGAFAGSALLKLSGVDREVKKVIPIDQIDVTTEYSSQARAYEPRVLLGKNLSLLDRQIRLEYSSSLLRKDDQRAAARVRLTPRLNLDFSWEQSNDGPIGDVGIDLKQRWEW